MPKVVEVVVLWSSGVALQACSRADVEVKRDRGLEVWRGDAGVRRWRV